MKLVRKTHATMDYDDGTHIFGHNSWAILYRQNPKDDLDNHTHFLGRYGFEDYRHGTIPESIAGYIKGVFRTRAQARAWLKEKKAAVADRDKNDWTVQHYKKYSIVRVSITICTLK